MTVKSDFVKLILEYTRLPNLLEFCLFLYKVSISYNYSFRGTKIIF